MKFKELDERMRVYETAHDRSILPGMYIVARLDGRGFTRLTKELINFDAPFDVRFRDHMVVTAKHLMECGFNILYAYVQSDEISLLFHPADNSFGRKVRKINSVLAAEASACFSLAVEQIATFDCRICEFPNAELVTDYFRWRNEDAARNALNAYCYWKLRQKGFSKTEAANQIEGISTAAKNELLFSLGINFNDLPLWQKRGVGIYRQEIELNGFDPRSGKEVTAIRKSLITNLELPMKEAYEEFIGLLLKVE